MTNANKRNINWTTRLVIPIIVSLSTGFIIALVAPVVLDYIRTPELRLEYSTIDANPFVATSTQIAAYQVVIRNSGAKVVEDVICRITIPNGVISQSNFILSTPITYTIDNSSDTLTVRIDNINPQESGTVHILVTSNNQLPIQPDVQLRANGITGNKAAAPTERQTDSLTYYATIIPAIVFTIFSFVVTIFISYFNKKNSGRTF